MDWYEEKIEEPIRDLVKYLRNNGVNTECSCGHEGYVQCQYIPEGELKRIHDLLYNFFVSKKLPINYVIEIKISVRNGNIFSTMDIKLG